MTTPRVFVNIKEEYQLYEKAIKMLLISLTTLSVCGQILFTDFIQNNLLQRIECRSSYENTAIFLTLRFAKL